jgi:hypothetical protein
MKGLIAMIEGLVQNYGDFVWDPSILWNEWGMGLLQVGLVAILTVFLAGVIVKVIKKAIGS